MASLKFNNYINAYLKTDLNVSDRDLLSEEYLEDDLFFEELLNYLETQEYTENFYRRREQFH